ncbi:MAG: hypothetical protein Q9202_001112 [Teloschistes flavicans]
MAEASVTSPGSTADSGKKPAIKNTQCQYCGTPFTTSSLGRHLDLYIRDKNPKQPDGVHDVDEIRRLRGNVTRRQAKSSTKREGSVASKSIRDQASPAAAVRRNGHSHPQNGAQRTEINRAGWEATGVINGLDPVPRASPSRLLSRAETSKSNKMDIARKEVAVEERDRALAVELALKEVLGNVKAASMRARPPAPFDFDFFRLNFPGLCLRCMLPPRSMSSHHSNLGQETWPLEPPGPSEFEFVKRYAFAKLQEWKARIAQDNTYSDQAGEPDQVLSDNIAKEEATYQLHYVHAYNNWQRLSQEQRQEEWHLACQKAYAAEYDRHQDTRDRLDQLEQEIHQLRDRLNNHSPDAQQRSPRSFVDTPLPLNRATAATIQQTHELHQWDHDRLIEKWRRRLRSQRSVQQPLPPPLTQSWSSPSRPLNGTPSVYDHQSSYPEEGDNEMEDEDLADAPGEEEEEGGMMGRDVLDPNLRNGTVDDGGKILMQLKNFQGTNGDGGIGR